MPVRVYYDNTGRVYYVEPLNVGVFFLPEGAEIERIDLGNPEEPIAITKPAQEASNTAIAEEAQQKAQEESADSPAEESKENLETGEA